VASGAITLEQWRRLALHIDSLFRARRELRGVVVTHGTDTMEETAYFLDLTVGGCRPVVLTGAMRVATAVGADGPANLRNAIRLAAAPQAAGIGAVILMNDEIFAARGVTKTNTSRMDTFAAPEHGILGVADPDTIALHGGRARRGCAAPPAFDLRRAGELPRVDIAHSYIGADGAAMDAAVAAGAKGIVVAGVGRGGMTPAQRAATDRAVARGVWVVVASRTGSGRVPVAPDIPTDLAPGRGVTMGAGELSPQQARILLMLALAADRTPRELAALLDRY
jgi:L-asparaginase